jgi:methylmalonyl-CoA/ethylmalonyl-CoA epimerase
MAFAVEDVQEALTYVQEAGCQVIDKTPRGGAEGLKIGFLHPKSTMRVLTELCGNK